MTKHPEAGYNEHLLLAHTIRWKTQSSKHKEIHQPIVDGKN